MHLRLYEPIYAEASPACGVCVPPGFTKITEKAQQGLERRLGYFGDERFVLFYYESRGHEVVWADRHTSGFGTGAWRTFFDDVDPLTRTYGVDLGCSGLPAEHVLMVDRESGEWFFGNRREARLFLARGAA